MSIPQIHVPSDLPDDARKMVEEVNELLRAVTQEVADLNANPDRYTLQQRLDVTKRCGTALDRFKQMREELRQYGLEWSEWPEIVE